MAVLQDLSQMQALLDKLMAENAALKAGAGNPLRCKISEKGALMVQGLGQWPVTLYRSQWERLIPFIPEVTKFIAANSAALSVKPAKE